MIELKVTKAKLTDYLRVFRLALEICDDFIITNDIIQPSESGDDDITGAHRLRHPLFPVTPGKVFQSVGNINSMLREIKDRTGVKSIYIVNTDAVLSIRMDYDEYILAIVREDTDSTTMFDDIIDKYVLSSNWSEYPIEKLRLAKSGNVINIGDDVHGSVRLSKSSFPFIGATRIADDVNFSGKYSLGIYSDVYKENYIASYIKYKHCDAFHMYVYIPYNE